jgi:hypothetical protein
MSEEAQMFLEWLRRHVDDLAAHAEKYPHCDVSFGRVEEAEEILLVARAHLE